MSRNPLKRFYECLTEQEEMFHQEFGRDNLGVMLRSAINEVDWYLYNYLESSHVTVEQQEHAYLLTLGITRLVKVALESREKFDVPVVMFRRDSENALRILEVLAGLGTVEHGRRVAQTVAAGIGEIEEVGTQDFVVTLPPEVPDNEFYEREISEHYRHIFNLKVRELSMEVVTEEVRNSVARKLEELVFPYMRHFIGYGASPLLDEYFFGNAYMEVTSWDGIDNFHPAARFGGVTFATYVLAVSFLVSLSQKHQRFAEALVKKDPGVRLCDILTITAERDGFLQSICDALAYFGDSVPHAHECTKAQAETIFHVLSVDRGRTAVLDRPGAPLPPIVCCSQSGFIRFQAGAVWSGSRFILESLKTLYPKEYSRNQQTREKAAQVAIQRILCSSIEGLLFRENITVRFEGRTLTDIDLVIGEEKTGLLLLCQLKHQEPHGMDLHAKRERGERLRRQVGSWLKNVEHWIDKTGECVVRDALRLPKNFPAITVGYAVVSQHHSAQLRSLMEKCDGTAFSLFQLFNAVNVLRGARAKKDLGCLLGILKDMDRKASQQKHAREEPVEWRIRHLRFKIRHLDETPDGQREA